MPERKEESQLIEDARLLFRNLAGVERSFNSEGQRNFSVILPPDLAKDMLKRGWRVKQLSSREEGEEGDFHIKVNLNYKTGRPPRVVLITSKGRNDLGPDEVGIIDAADIEKVDVLINGYYSDMAGGGYSAYLKSMFVTLREDELEQMYANVLEEPDNTEWSEAS